MKILLLVTASLGLGLMGCAGPEVTYQVAPKADESGLTKFQFADSVIQFAYPTSGNNVDNTHISVTSTPVAATAKTYAVTGVPWYENWFTETDINATHANNSLTLSQVGDTVTDEFPTVIGDLAGAATAGMTILGSGAVPSAATSSQAQPPTGIVVSTFLSDVTTTLAYDTKSKSGCTAPKGVGGPITCTGLTLEGGGVPAVDSSTKRVIGVNPYVADIQISALPDDAISPSLLDRAYTTGSYLYSACRTLQIKITAPDQSVVAQTSVLVSDPTMLETLAIPPNGKVTTNGSCGADSVAGTYTPPDFFKDLGSALTAANSVKTQLSNSSGAQKK